MSQLRCRHLFVALIGPYICVCGCHSATDGVKVFMKASDNPLPFSTQKNERVVVPDFCLVRNFPMDIHDNG